MDLLFAIDIMYLKTKLSLIGGIINVFSLLILLLNYRHTVESRYNANRNTAVSVITRPAHGPRFFR